MINQRPLKEEDVLDKIDNCLTEKQIVSFSPKQAINKNNATDTIPPKLFKIIRFLGWKKGEYLQFREPGKKLDPKFFKDKYGIDVLESAKLEVSNRFPEEGETLKLFKKIEENDLMIESKDFQKIFQNVYMVKVKPWQELKLRFKYVQSIETQDNKREAKHQVKSYGTRTYFKLEVTEDCLAILNLNQEDEDEIGIAKTRPNTDLGLVLMQKKEGVFKLVKFVEPRKQREIYWETHLKAGDYYLVPKSFGRNVMGRKGFMGHGNVASEAEMFKGIISQKRFMISKEDERMTSLGEDDYNEKSQFVTSVIEDIYRKMDLEIKGFLTEKELGKIRRHLLPKCKDLPFESILKQFELKSVSGKPPKGLSIFGFKRFFKDMIKRNSNVEEVLKMFDFFGYDKQLFSFKSRLITFGLYSTKKIHVKSKDALKGKKFNFRQY